MPQKTPFCRGTEPEPLEPEPLEPFHLQTVTEPNQGLPVMAVVVSSAFKNSLINSGCRKRSAAKGVRSLFFFGFGTLLVTFRSLFLVLLSLFSRYIFAKLLLPDSFCGRVRTDGNGIGNFPKLIGPAPVQKCVGDFCGINFGGFCREFSWRIFWALFPTKMRENKSGDKIRKKIRRPKNKNPRKIRSAKIRP